MTTDIGHDRPSKVLTNGTIHSLSEPYAEALVVEDGLISWVGSAETAQRMSQRGLEVQDLDRGLVTPAFVGWVDLPAPPPERADAETAKALDAAAAQGCGAVRLNLEVSVAELSDDAGLPAWAMTSFSVAAGHPVRVYPVVTLSEQAGNTAVSRLEALDVLLGALHEVDSLFGRPAAVQLDLSAVLGDLLSVRLRVAEAGRQALLDAGRQAGDPTADAPTGPAAVVSALVETTAQMRRQRLTGGAGLPTVLVGFDSASREDWEVLLNTGAQVLLRGWGHLATALSVGVPVSAVPPAGENPWSVVSAHVHHGQDPVSVRAGFNAQTRAAYRSLPEGSGELTSSATLDAGSRATFAIWEVDSLAVQTPDSRTAAWSTDVRARTPLLPYLDGESLPVLVSTVIDGVEVHRSASAAGR